LEAAADVTLTVDKVLTGSGALTKSGAGTVVLTQSNTYEGKTSVTAGELSVDDESAFGTAPAGNVADQLTLSGGVLNTTATFVIDDANRGVTLGSAGGTFNPDAATILTVENEIAGSGTLTKTGNGTLILNDGNTYTGKTVVNAGALNISSESGLGANPAVSTADQLTLNGGTLLTTATFAIDDANRGITLDAAGGTFEQDTATTLTMAGAIAGTGSLTKAGDGSLVLSAANTFSGPTAVAAGTLEVAHADALQNSTLAIGAAGQVTLTVLGTNTYQIGGLSGDGGMDMGSNTLSIGANNLAATYSGALSGAGGGLIKVGSGVATLSGSNSYDGVTLISSGTLQFAKPVALYGGNTALWTANNIVVNTGASLAINVGGTDEFASSDLDILNSLGSVAGGFQSGSSLALDTTFAAGGTFTYTGILADPFGNMRGLRKIGAGMVTLTADNTYTGPTRLEEGVLSISSLADGGAACGIGASLSNAVNLVFAGGALRYTGPTVSTDHLYTFASPSGTVFEVTQPGTSLTFESVRGCAGVGASSVYVKNGPGTLLIGNDGIINGGAGTYIATIAAFEVNGGTFLTVSGDHAQLNVGRRSDAGPALTLGDGAYLGFGPPLGDTAANIEQVVWYKGTNLTATMSGMTLSGPSASGYNSKVFDINDGASEVDLIVSSSFSTYPVGAVSRLRKEGAGTLKLKGTTSKYVGTTIIRNGRILLNLNVPSGGLSVLGDCTEDIQLGDEETQPGDQPTFAFEGTGTYIFSRGITVYPSGAYPAFGCISNVNASFNGAITVSNDVRISSVSLGANAVTINGMISGPSGIVKTGSGTVVLTAANSYTGVTTVTEGTLRLSAANRINAASALRLTGGTFDTAGFYQTLATLDVDGDAVIDFEDGASVLTFNASDSETWEGTLTLQNWNGSATGGGTDQLFVGTTADGLTEAQLEKVISPTGESARQLYTGEVVFMPHGTLIMVR
jgi:fibronectin-binding autotransporter adhesin